MSFFDWEIEQAKTNGINDCPFCDGLCVMSQIGNEHTKKLCLEIECTNCHVKRKQCILNSSGGTVDTWPAVSAYTIGDVVYRNSTGGTLAFMPSITL